MGGAGGAEGEGKRGKGGRSCQSVRAVRGFGEGKRKVGSLAQCMNWRHDDSLIVLR